MAGGKQITNPNGAFGYTNTTDAESNNFQITGEFTVGGSVAVVAGDAIALIWSETLRTLLCEPWDTNAAGQTVKIGVGVALDSAAVAATCKVVLFGFAMVNIGTGTATEGYAVKGTTTKGEVVEDNADASDIAGEVLGFFLGDEDGTRNLAPMWVSPR